MDGVDPAEPSGALLRGSCGYGAFSRDIWPFWSVATASAYNFALLGKGSSGCGACLQVSCSGSVECQPPEGMVMRVKEYSLSGDGFIRVVPTQVAGTGTLQSVELRASAGQGVSDLAHSWRQMNNTFGAAWDLYDLYPPPFDLRFRDSVGRTVIVDNAIPEAAQGDYPTDAQFSTADRPGGSSEPAQGTPLLPQHSSSPQPQLPPGPGDAGAPAPAPALSPPAGTPVVTIVSNFPWELQTAPLGGPATTARDPIPAAPSLPPTRVTGMPPNHPVKPFDAAGADPPIQQFAVALHPPLVGVVRTPSPAPELVQLPFSRFVIPSATGLTSFLMDGDTSQTVFAPVNSAWQKQPPPSSSGTDNSRALTNLMLVHVALGNRNASIFNTTVAASGSSPQSPNPNFGGAVPVDTLQGSAVFIRPPANDNQGLIVGDSAGTSGTPTNFVQATCLGTVYGLDAVLSPPT
ncbi:hypothetical protein COCOBI_10-4900 [Coccomyxa sp. Obi]|nr:hypothetical protein COCOBI_10-4900 [Coccomyxa sp. Obi]